MLAVVTGASRGIGKAVSVMLAKKNIEVAMVSTKESKSSKQTEKEVNQFSKGSFFYTDVSDYEGVEAVAKKIHSEYGKADILINCAGITRDGLLLGMEKDAIDTVIDVNLKGTIFFTKAFIGDFLRKRNGVIINISSVVGLTGNVGQSNYAASKAGVIGFSKSVAMEYAKKNVRCNVICPGFISTDMTDKLDEGVKTAMKNNIPLGRFGAVTDVANLVEFLCSESAAYITGEVIRVDGGMCI